MEREENSDSIPMDLIIEILSKLPANSIGKFRCVSKLWRSLLSPPYITELFLTISWARPRLFFVLSRNDEWSFFSSPQPQIPYKKSSAKFHMKFSKDSRLVFRGLTSGLIFLSEKTISTFSTSKGDEDEVHVIFNPRTLQYSTLPKVRRHCLSKTFLGFDPIDKKFKVLHIDYDGHFVLTFETGNMKWNKIHCPSYHYPLRKHICINGVLYYLAQNVHSFSRVIVCFDVRYEKFKFIDVNPSFDQLINYKGNLGLIYWTRSYNTLCVDVLDDVEKQEWSKYVYTFSDDKHFLGRSVSVIGMTSKGELVLSMESTSKPFYVFYLNPERNTLRSVEIQGFGEYYEDNEHRVQAFVDYVDDLNVMQRYSSQTNA